MGVTALLLYIVIFLLSVVLYNLKLHRSYWKRRGIPHDEPDLIAGSLKGILQTRHMHTIMKDYYDKYKGTGPFAGFYFVFKPAVFILDLDLVKNILIRDFHNFTDRGFFNNPRDDPLSGHLFNLDGEKWTILRARMSSSFTSAKMKLMFPTVVSIGNELVDKLSQLIQVDPIVDMTDLFTRFTVDVIGNCGFGLDTSSLKDPQAEFRIMGTKAFQQRRHSRLGDGFMFSFPELARKLRMKQTPDEVQEFYIRIVRETVRYREENNIKRNDFMNSLIEMKNSAQFQSIEEVAAQAFFILVAGFETSSGTIGFALFELAVNQDIQDRLRDEIVQQLERHGGEFSYECMLGMRYMDKVIKETLRKYSLLTNVFRKALADYPTSNPKYTIPKGAMILIPIDAIHRDPDIYPDPEKFDPERFSPEEVQKRHPITWLPFGEGRRNCIGQRFGKMEICIGLAMLLRQFKFYYSEKTPNPLEIDIQNILNAPKGGIHLRVERI